MLFPSDLEWHGWIVTDMETLIDNDTGKPKCCTKFEIRMESMVDYFSTIGQCRH